MSGRTAGAYARVSTTDQSCETQRDALRQYSEARGWALKEFVDQGVSGAREHRPALDDLLDAARRREIDVVAVTKLDRLARSLRQLVAIASELAALGVNLIVLDQAIDSTTPSGRLLFHMLGAIAEFERDLIRDRVISGLRRAQAHGTKSGRRIGRPRKHWLDPDRVRALIPNHGVRGTARLLHVPPSAVSRAARLTGPEAEAMARGARPSQTAP